MSSVKLNEEEKRLLHNAWHHFLTITHHKPGGHGRLL